MAIKALTKIIFKRIRGRIVPIRTKLDPSVRKEVKRAIAQRTSTSMKRIKAIRAVRLTLQGKTRMIGRGTQADTYSAGKNVVKMANETSFPKHVTAQQFEKRAMIKAILGKKLAPETFLVKTKKQSFLVQQRGEDAYVYRHRLGSRIDNPKSRGSMKNWSGRITRGMKDRYYNKYVSIPKQVEILKQRIRQKGIEPSDYGLENTIIRKGKILASDSGEFIRKKTPTNDQFNKIIKKYWIEAK